MYMKRKHSPDLLYAFALSLVFAVIDGAVFALTAEPLGSVLRFTPVWLCNIVHAAAIACVGTLLGCCSMLALGRGKRHLTPWGYSFFAVYLALCYGLAAFGLPAESRQAALELVAYGLLPPTLIGMGLSWGLYALWKRRQMSM